MKVVSINAAVKRQIEFNGEQVPTGIFKEPLEGPVVISESGIHDDAIVDKSVHGGPDQALYLYHLEDYEWWSESLGKTVSAGAFGENLTVSGLSGRDWVIGDRLRINEVLLEVTAPRVPCFKLGVKMGDPKIVKQFVKARRPGTYVRVLQGGTMQAGDTIILEQTRSDYATVTEVFDLWHSKHKTVAQVQKALDSPLASFHRNALSEWMEGKA